MEVIANFLSDSVDRRQGNLFHPAESHHFELIQHCYLFIVLSENVEEDFAEIFVDCSNDCMLLVRIPLEDEFMDEEEDALFVLCFG